MSSSHRNRFIDRAFELAEEALSVGEVPVGCVIVLDRDPISDSSTSIEPQIIAEGRNEVNERKNATRHAEIVAIDRVLYQTDFDSSIFANCTFYVTVEPCILCADALLKLKTGRVVFCCKNERFGGFGSVLNVGQSDSSTEIVSVDEETLKEKAVGLLQRFYSGQNPNAPIPKVKGEKVKR